MDRVKVAVVGVGCRGFGMIDAYLSVDFCDVVAVCDVYQDRVDAALKKIRERRGCEAKGYTDFEELLKHKGDFDCVYISTSWEEHVKQSIRCMEESVPVGMEVGGAYSIDDCWKLVDTYEATKTPFMMMENCCYDKFELLTTALARKGMLGTIVGCHGAYAHDLRAEILGGNVNRHYRLRNYIARNCENYPTHELGPIARLLNINRGNRMVSVVSVASKPAGLHEYSCSDKSPDKSLAGQEFAQADLVNTIIKCENGETITMRLDTSLPRYYSREFYVHGTKGLANQECNMILLDGDIPEYFRTEETIGKCLNNAEKYHDYLPDYWRNITQEEIDLGHGGMDVLMVREFLTCVRDHLPMKVDVYDAAAWYSITPLSAMSIKENGKPYEIPDFTRGKYRTNPAEDVVKMN